MNLNSILSILIAVSFSVNSCNREKFNDQQRSVPKEKPEQYGVPFEKVPDRRDVTIYQVNMRSFSEEGNLQGVIERLDSIRALGVNVVYLMPVYPVGKLKSVNSPYCISDYSSVSSEFGTLDDLRLLVEEAHNRDMAVILDWVANHTAFDHGWTARKSWYLTNEAGEIIDPPGHNWKDVAQLNFSNREMRLEMIKTMQNWVFTANIDGFRCDYSDGPPYDFWKQAIDSLRNITSHKLLLLSEGSRSDHFTAGFDYNFGFAFFSNLKKIFRSNYTVKSLENLNISDFAGATDGQQMVRYTSNHDVNSSDGTPLDLFGGERGAMASFVVVAYMKGIPMIYNGQEVGTPYRLTFPFTSTSIEWDVNYHITAEYKKIIAFRNQSNAIRRGELKSFCSDDVCAFVKQQGEEKVLVFVNLRNFQTDLPLVADLKNSEWTNVFNGEKVKVTEAMTLKPYEYLVLKN